MSDIPMPALGESVTEGTVTRWLKQVGDPVEVDEPLLEISTDKVDTEIPSPVAGTLLEILVAEDETVSVGTTLARVGSAEGGAQPTPAEPPATVAPVPPTDARETPDVPAATPDIPAATPDVPAATPDIPAATPDVPAATPDVPSATPDVEEAPPPSEPVATGQPPELPEAPTPDRAPSTASGPESERAEEVLLPALGESVTEGTVTRWLKQVGDPVEVDEPLLEISTDKVDTEIPSPVAGTVLEILVAEDQTVAVGTPLVRIGSLSGESAQQPTAQQPKAQQPTPQQPPPQQPPAQQSPVTAPIPTQEPPLPRVEPSPVPRRPEQPQPSAGYLTPLVRKLAADQGVDLAVVTGTGVGGRIRKDDVLGAAAGTERAAPTGTQAPSERPTGAADLEVSPLRGTTEKASRLRQIIASRMVEALQTMAQLTTVIEVDVTKIALLRSRAKEAFRSREGVNLSYLPFFVLAATEALKTHPKINGFLEGDQITYHGQENVGIAVDTVRGLVVPVIRDAGDLNLAGIARKIADLAARTRENKVTPDELSGATFTVTNTGWGGAVFDTPIVPVGTSAILGTGAIVKRPVVVADENDSDHVAIRSMCYLALSYDHRLVDGADAARYLAAIKSRLEEGDFEADLGL